MFLSFKKGEKICILLQWKSDVLYKKRYKYAQDYFKGEYDDEKIYYDRLGFTGNDDPKRL